MQEKALGMSATPSDESPFILLGLARHIEESEKPFPLMPIDIYGLSYGVGFYFFPISLEGFSLILLCNSDRFIESGMEKGQLVFRPADSGQPQYMEFQLEVEVKEGRGEDGAEMGPIRESSLPTFSPWILTPLKGRDILIPTPGQYYLEVSTRNANFVIGSLFFIFEEMAPYSHDQIKAMEADPNSLKAVSIELACKECGSKMGIYTSLERKDDLEAAGFIWQYDLKDEMFLCACGATNLKLDYLKRGLHAMLLKPKFEFGESVSFTRRYGHSRIVNICKQYQRVISGKPREEVVQKFIEENPVMLAHFRGTRLFYKPKILGQHVADFGVVDSKGRLILIELERPGINLFKEDGHIAHELTHAYGQVTDWLELCRKHRDAVIEGLGLNPQEILNIKGAVVAGLDEQEDRAHLFKHRHRPPYGNDVEFLTLNDLATSLLSISERLV